MKRFVLYFSAVWILCRCCCLVCGRDQGVCSVEKLITRINLTTELQSEILLPCLFKPALTGSNLDMNSSAVWAQITENTDAIVEIKVNDHEMFWNNRGNRIKAFGAAAASGNFSILIEDVQLSDLGLYRCEHFRDTNCSLGYKEIEISLAAEFSPLNNWQLIVAAGGGGFLLLCLITVCVYCTWTKRQTVDASVNHTSHNCHDSEGQKNDEITYASVVPKSHNCHDSEGQKNDEITYASVALKSHNCHDSEVLLNNKPVKGSASETMVNPETVLYSTLKQREGR
ncbi:uncharacterized protein LOC127957981 isoform X2 [Carassius gibelio]|uniref:uncharacterized protein LOC127957981 isoform X2 n=1 Tax=Carassius gibelio TaxID=101364 RepID=UPI002277666C|nr:uncharacterized protein LOC127957981 isoform X2 [Carassius gibelio]